MRDEKVIPKAVRTVVCAMCADYFRRKLAIEKHTVSLRTKNEYKYYNFKIYDAVVEIIGARYAEDIIREIGENVGYAKTDIPIYAETAYKYKKRAIINNIARKLRLID